MNDGFDIAFETEDERLRRTKGRTKKKVILNYQGELHVLSTDDESEHDDAMREMLGGDADYLDDDIGDK